MRSDVILLACALAFLAGCGVPNGGDAPAAGNRGSVPGDRAGSWMAPEARGADLLYASDLNDNDVAVFNYKTGRQVGLLAGFSEPEGQCVDAQGDVWITNALGDQVMEYAHGGTVPLQVLTTDGAGIGCSINPLTGDLAVANWFASGKGGGDIQIFKHASGTPTDYANADCAAVFPPGYDDKGNLYFEALASSYRVCELAARANTIVPVVFPEPIPTGSSVMWDGRHIAIAVLGYQSSSHTAIYQVKRRGAHKLTVVGTTLLSDDCNGPDALVAQPFIVGKKNTPVNVERGKTVVGVNFSCSRRLDRWAYPGGGRPVWTGEAPYEVGGDSVSLVVK